MKDAFEIYYCYGGHCGPFEDIGMAEAAAKRRIVGDTSGRLTSIEIRPRDSKAIGGYAHKNYGSFYIERPINDIDFRRRAVNLHGVEKIIDNY